MTTRNEDCPSSSLRVSMDARKLFPILYYTIYDLMTPYRIFNPSSTKFRISLEKFNHLINTRRACAARVTVLGSCVCVSVRSISATTSKSKPRKRYQRFIATRQREKKRAISFKMLRSKVMASFTHFVGVRRSCRALKFILTATEAAIATQKPNGKLNAC